LFGADNQITRAAAQRSDQLWQKASTEGLALAEEPL
jgi:hypothetical protein